MGWREQKLSQVACITLRRFEGRVDPCTFSDLPAVKVWGALAAEDFPELFLADLIVATGSFRLITLNAAVDECLGRTYTESKKTNCGENHLQLQLESLKIPANLPKLHLQCLLSWWMSQFIILLARKCLNFYLRLFFGSDESTWRDFVRLTGRILPISFQWKLWIENYEEMLRVEKVISSFAQFWVDPLICPERCPFVGQRRWFWRFSSHHLGVQLRGWRHKWSKFHHSTRLTRRVLACRFGGLNTF